MKYSVLGATRTPVSKLCLGTNVFGWNADEATAHEIMTAFSELGGNFIDTADSYSVWVEGNPGGVSEGIIGNWLSQRSREEFVIATKVGQMPDFPGYDLDYVTAQLERSLTNLRTPYVDVYYAHKDHDGHPMAHLAKIFHDLVESGKVRNIGLSNFSAERTQEWLEVCDAHNWHRPSVIQPHYNLMVRSAYESGLGILANEQSLSVIPYAGLARGFLSGRYDGSESPESTTRASQALQYATPEGLVIVSELTKIAARFQLEVATVALAWVLSRHEIVAPIASASKVSQLPALIAATEWEIPGDVVSSLNALPNGETL